MERLGHLFAVTLPVWEIVLRGSAMYLGLLVLSRFFLKRDSAAAGLSDVLVVVLLADAAQNGMAGDYDSITEGLILVCTILGWSLLIDWLGFRSALVGRWVHPPSLLLVKDGVMLYRNLRRELITREELEAQIRVNGIDSVEQVKEARMEGDGSISVIPRERTR